MRAELVFLTGEMSGTTVPIAPGGFRVGRELGLDLVVPPGDERFVSRQHAALSVGEDGVRIVDLGSTNGTWVNGKRVREARLRDGDLIEFGYGGPRARIGISSGALPPPPAPMPVPGGERPSQLVRRLVDDAIARRERGRGALGLRSAALVALAVVVGVAASVQVGWPGTEAGFRRYADDYRDRVAFIEVGLLLEGDYYPLGFGSGFVADPSGLIVTNKHVVQGWHYSQDTACILESLRRRRIDPDEAIVVSAWRGGSTFRQSVEMRQGDRGLGYSTEYGTLDVVAVAADNLAAERRVVCSDALGGSDFTMGWRRHLTDNNDLAVLRVADSLPAIPLAEEPPEADDPVMVLGFPSGITPLETNVADPIRRVGRVLRIQETVQIDAVVLHGNSGGPLIDSRGEVVGVTTRGPAESLNMAIKIEYAVPLLDRARQVP